jgi:hypothetical protein
MWIVVQDFGLLDKTYTKSFRQTIYNNCNTDMIFRIKDSDTAKYIVDTRGQKDVIKKVDSTQISPSDMGDRRTIADQQKTELIILPSEITNLTLGEAYLNATGLGVAKIKIPNKKYEIINKHFINIYNEENYIKPQLHEAESFATTQSLDDDLVIEDIEGMGNVYEDIVIEERGEQ